jgi:glutathione S-transferase
MLTYYFAPGSSSMAPHIALHEIGVPFESRPLSFARNETRAPAFLAINPEGKVPTLIVDGRMLTEVAAILYYLARRHPEAGMWPEDDLDAQAQVLSWMSFIASSLHPNSREPGELTRMLYALADRRLGTRDWAIGRYSIADIHLFRLFWRNRKRLKAESDEYPNLARHYERMMARPAVAKTCAIEAAIGYELPD